jgi:hypothetical protein
MIRLRASWIASGLTSETISGTSGSMRNAEELSITVTPARYRRGSRNLRTGTLLGELAIVSASVTATPGRPRTYPASEVVEVIDVVEIIDVVDVVAGTCDRNDHRPGASTVRKPGPVGTSMSPENEPA